MPNPHFVTYVFRNDRLPSGDLARLFVKFKINTEGTIIVSTSATDEDCYVNDYGSLEWNYDFENFLLVPGFLKLRIAVPNGMLFQKYFFETVSPFIFAEKEAEVTLEVKYVGTSNFITEFKGFVIDDSISYDPDRGYLIFTAAPRTDILNRQMLYDLNGVAINPLGYEVPTPTTTYYRRTEAIIEDCFELVNPSVTMEFYHDWLFRGQGPSGYVEDLVFSEVFQDIRPLFFDQTKGLNSIGDLLRKLAMDWFCIAGMIHQDKAFFKKLFSVSSSYILSEDTYYNYSKAHKLNLIHYVHYKIPNNVIYDEGTFTELEGQYIQRESLIGFYEGPPGFTNILAVRASVEHNVWKAKDLLISSSFQDYGNLITPLWFNYRGDITKCRIDPIVTPGINHSILQNPIFQNRTYQPIRLKKLFMDGVTEIDGLLIDF